MPSNKPQHTDLLLIDDILPSDFSPFRTLEYRHYLTFFDSVLLSLEGWHLWVGNETFEELVKASPLAPAECGRIMRFQEGADMAARLAYVTFLGNARRLMPFFKARSLPFILQLYPGGGFEVNQPTVDEALREVLLCELCRGVIVTQTITRDYIQDRIGVDPAKVTMVFGGVFDSRVDFDFSRDKVFYQKGKETLDLCFVAHKYPGDRSSKGYDQFVAIARGLAPQFPQLRFHVVGEYLPDDIALDEAADRFTFYGRQPSSFFADFYPRMDAIVSVNKPFVLAPGAFDGFPTGACIEAGFRGVLNCINDPLDLNPTFAHDRDIILLDFDTQRSITLLRDLLGNPQHLYELAYANWSKFHVVFDVDAQLWARSRVIVAELVKAPRFITTVPEGAVGLDAPPGIRVGRNVHISAYSAILGREAVDIADFATISVRCAIFSSSDDYSGATMANATIPDQYRGSVDAPVSVQPHALIGAGCIILPGVTVGESASVAAASLVKTDVAPYDVVAGVPAQVIGRRLSEHRSIAAKLLRDERVASQAHTDKL
jgi:acetyltransferase-like isoleucine patch superfamily enzyme